MLRYLREPGNYLSPGTPITILSGVGALLRGLLLKPLVWLPILVALLVVLFGLQVLVLDGAGKPSSTRLSLLGTDQAFHWPEAVCCQPCENADENDDDKKGDRIAARRGA